MGDRTWYCPVCNTFEAEPHEEQDIEIAFHKEEHFDHLRADSELLDKLERALARRNLSVKLTPTGVLLEVGTPSDEPTQAGYRTSKAPSLREALAALEELDGE